MTVSAAQRIQRIFDIASAHLQTVQGCLDMLVNLDAHEELARLSDRLQKLAVRAKPH